MTRDLCRLMQRVERNPQEKVDWTVGEFLQMRTHVKVCEACKAIVKRVSDANPEKPRIGPAPQEN